MGTNYSTAFGPHPLVSPAPGDLAVFSAAHLQCPHETFLILQSRVFDEKDGSTIMFIDGEHSTAYAKVAGVEARRVKGEGNVFLAPNGVPLLRIEQVEFSMQLP